MRLSWRGLGLEYLGRSSYQSINWQQYISPVNMSLDTNQQLLRNICNLHPPVKRRADAFKLNLKPFFVCCLVHRRKVRECNSSFWKVYLKLVTIPPPAAGEGLWKKDLALFPPLQSHPLLKNCKCPTEHEQNSNFFINIYVPAYNYCNPLSTIHWV